MFEKYRSEEERMRLEMEGEEIGEGEEGEEF